MILRSIRTRMYKNISDSGDVDIRDRVTCLVGKNESGKSSLLESIYRLNPVTTGHPETFLALRDYPRRHYTRDRDRVAATRPITATFELAEEDVHAVEAVHGPGTLTSRLVTVSRTYDNELEWEIHRREERQTTCPAMQATESQETGDEGAPDAPFFALASGQSPPEPPREHAHAQPDRSPCADIERILQARLPGFLYFDEYSVIPGRLSISRLNSTGARSLNPSECTALSLFRLAGVDVSHFDAEDYEARRASLEAVANEITDQVLQFWSQNPDLSVDIDIDRDASDAARAPCIDIRIRNQRHRITLNFNERSRGFTWFFSFLATLTELRRSERAVLLLDEPGLGLHGAAQRDLLRFIDERLAPAHQVIYSTHSPFMIRAADLDRVRTVEDQDPAGSRVSHAFFDHSEETRLPLQASVGRELIRSLPVDTHALLVADPADHVFLTALSSQLEMRGRASLDPRCTVVPVGGLSGVCAFAALLDARLHVTVITDVHGGEYGLAASPLGQDLLARKGIIRIADFTATPEADIEDLFAEAFYVELVNRSRAAALEPFEIHGTGRIVERIRKAVGTGFNRYLPARFLLEHPEPLAEGLDDSTLERFEALFRKVNESVRAC